MLGSLLIQPQMLARLQSRSADDDLIDEAFAIAHRLVGSPGLVTELAPAFVSAMGDLAARMRTRLEPRLPAFDKGLNAALTPWLEGLAASFGGAAPAGAADLLDQLAAALDKLQDIPAALRDERLRTGLRRTAQLCSSELGLSQDLLRDELNQTLAGMALALRGLQDISPAARATAQALACLLERLRGLGLAQLPRLDLGIDRLVDLLLVRLHGAGFDHLREHLACLLGKLRAVLGAGAAVVRALPAAALGTPRAGPRRHAVARAATQAVTGDAARSAARDATVLPAPPGPRSTDGRYCWYASWLYAQRLQSHWQWLPGYPGDEVWQSLDDTELALRTVSGADVSLYRGGEALPWYKLAPFGSVDNRDTRFSFGVFAPEFLEVFTRVSAAATDTGKGIWHLVRMARSPQEYGQFSLLMWAWLRAISSGAASKPFASFITHLTQAPVGRSWFITPMITWLLVFGFAFEGIHTKTANPGAWIGYFGTLLGADALNAWVPDRLLRGGHDLVLSLFTLINQTGPVNPGEPVPANHAHGLPVVEAVTFLSLLLYVLVIPRHFYAYPGYGETPEIWAFWLLGAPAVGAVGGMLGALAVWALARHVDWGNFARQAGWGALRGLRDFILYLYLFREGDTDDGRYTPKIDNEGDEYAPPRDDFEPYPDKEDSPYKLPYVSGTAYFVGQSHLGFFSHMALHKSDKPQVYAIDFGHDFRDEILAARDGTVVDWFDFVPDDTDLDEAAQLVVAQQAFDFMAAQPGVDMANWRGNTDTTKRNYVLVFHDTAAAGHDKSFGGAATATYAIYMHGATGGVRETFKDHYGIDPKDIIGTRVRQGNPIMLAGDTGKSMHNHLHMHVQPGMPPQPPVPGARVRVADSSLPTITLPYVFADVEGNGVPERLTWYRSGNARTVELP